MRSIRKLLQDLPNTFFNIKAVRAHSASFLMYALAILLRMISLTFDSISDSDKAEKIEKSSSYVLFFILLALNFVSLLILLYIFNGLVTIEIDR
jgi:hypothetical protein